jgi:hypothetical protein
VSGLLCGVKHGGVEMLHGALELHGGELYDDELVSDDE